MVQAVAFRKITAANSKQYIGRLSKAVSTLGTWEIIPFPHKPRCGSKSSCEDTSTSKATTFESRQLHWKPALPWSREICAISNAWPGLLCEDWSV